MGAMELRPDSHGKVRDIYDCGDSLLMVASDRISAFDYILPDEIPSKGEVLTRVSAFWFEKFADIIPNHLITMDVSEYPEEYQRYAAYLAGRSMLVKKAEPLPIECIVRGYLTGSGKKTYDADRTVCGITLPDGLTEASKLPEEPKVSARPVEVGDTVEILSMGVKATVTAIAPNRTLTLRAGIMNVTAKESEVYLLPDQQKVKVVTSSGQAATLRSASAPSEIDLRGFERFEAVDAAERFIDAAVMAKLEEVRIIHGKGTGALRTAIQEMLKKNKAVKRFRLGKYGEGESGVTVVTLK